MALVSLLVTLIPVAPFSGRKIASPTVMSEKFWVPATVLSTITGVPADALTYLMYMYVESDTELDISVSGPVELVTVPDAMFTTGCSIAKLSAKFTVNPEDVVVEDPLEVSVNRCLIVPIVVLY